MRHRPPQHLYAAAAAMLLLATAAVAETIPATTQPASAEARLFAERVTLLASPVFEGRAPGTAGLDKARDLIVAAFDHLGLQPAFGGQFTQSFQTSVGIVPREQALAVNGQALAPEQDFNALGFSESKAFDGEAVFVGYGICDPGRRYDNYAGVDVKGKVAVAYRYEPQDDKGVSLWTGRPDNWTPASHLTNKATWAAQRGAVALLLVSPPSQRAGGDPLRSTRQTAGAKVGDIAVFQISESVFARILEASTRHGQRAQAALQLDADRSADAAAALQGVRLAGQVKLERDEATVANVAGLLPGRGALAGELLVIGAHYDHLGYGNAGSLSGTSEIHPGADDNASGAAALLAVAERLARDAGDEPRRTILFAAFTAEESGLIGSSYLLKHFDDTGFAPAAVCAMLNLDMVGRLQDDRLLVMGVGSGHGWSKLITDAVRGAGLKAVTQERARGSSDHAAFYRSDIPAVHFFTGAHKDYHRPSDTAEKINADGAVKVVDAVTAVARALASRTERISFDADGAREAGQMHGAFGGAFLGVVPDYATLDGDDGCGISGVSPGSPAEAAGLRADDFITAWNGHKVANVHDLSTHLSKAGPGDVVKLTVKRGKETIALDVTLGRR